MSLRMLLAAAIMSIALAGCAASTAGRSDTTTSELAVRAQIAAWQSAAARQDAPGLAALYAEDATVLYPGPPEIRGRAAVERLWRSIFQSATVAIVPGRVEVSPAGDVAVEYAQESLRRTRKAGNTD